MAEAIDRLMSTDLVGRGFISQGYKLARAQTSVPLVQDAGDRLLAAVAEQKAPVVFIVTGATSQRTGLPVHIGELDGPPGAIALARTLALACGVAPILLTDPNQGGMLSAAAASLGMYTLSPEDVILQARETTHAASLAVIEIPDHDTEAREQAARLIDQLKPVAAIAIEKAGKNEHGIFHNMRKINSSPGKACADQLFSACHSHGILTIGIGDGGNEIGMGKIKKELASVFPDMTKCACPCGGSIFADQKTDCLIAACVSNWGAYALAAYLAYARNQPYAAHSGARERQLLEGAAKAGYMNLDGFASAGADALPVEIHESFVRLLSTLTLWPALSHGRRGYLADMLPR